MRPEGLSRAGFLGPKESLLNVKKSVAFEKCFFLCFGQPAKAAQGRTTSGPFEPWVPSCLFLGRHDDDLRPRLEAGDHASRNAAGRSGRLSA
jgi:hypothetical protein